MKNVPMIMMLTAPYLLLGLYLSEATAALPAGLVLFAAVMFLGALYAFFLPRCGYSGTRILFWCMLLKLCNIPVFLLIFIAALGLFVVIIPLIPLLIIFDYLLLLSTSMYGISGLLTCGKERRLSAKAVTLNIILQFFFCADVLSSIYCYIKSKKRPEGL